MEDEAIVALFWQRNENAIAACQQKYGGFCGSIARNILGSAEDAEECVNDALGAAWDSIPPQRPRQLRIFLGCVTRNLALSRWRSANAQKRGSGMCQLLGELEDCVPDVHTPETALENQTLAACIEDWLRGLPKAERVLFLRRYWLGTPLKELAAAAGETPAKLAQRMYRLRGGLRAALEKEGIHL